MGIEASRSPIVVGAASSGLSSATTIRSSFGARIRVLYVRATARALVLMTYEKVLALLI